MQDGRTVRVARWHRAVRGAPAGGVRRGKTNHDKEYMQPLLAAGPAHVGSEGFVFVFVFQLCRGGQRGRVNDGNG